MAARPYGVVKTLEGDGRHQAYLVEAGAEAGAQVLKVPTWCEPDAFLAHARKLQGVAHPSVRRVREAGRLSDGRPYVLVDPAVGPALAEAGPLSFRAALELGVQLAQALGALHRAGVSAGALRPSDVFLSAPPVADVSLAAVGTPASVRSDVRALVRLLLEAGVRRGADARVRAQLEAVSTVEALEGLLRSMLDWFRTGTPATEATVEVLEPDLVGCRLGPWQLEALIGEGAIGRVYLARRADDGEPAAVKVLKLEHALDAEVRRRFELEGEAAQAVRDEHLVALYELGELTHPHGRLLYRAMELLEGQSLAHALTRGPFELARAVGITAQLVQGLHAAHQVGIVHRDVKPDNVFLHRRGEDPDFVKILDFGLAKVLRPIGRVTPPETLSGTAVGTPEYMAPEQAIGMPVDSRTDLFAVGLVLYELIVGRSPYQEVTFARRIVELTHTVAPRLPLVTVRGERTPEGLSALVARCLEREPAARFQSGAELSQALEGWARTVASGR